MKFAILPKNIPIGETIEIKSEKIIREILYDLLEQITAMTTPINPP